MTLKASYNSLSEYFPRRESFHNMFASWMQIKGSYLGLSTTLDKLKQANVKKEFILKDSIISSQWSSLNLQPKNCSLDTDSSAVCGNSKEVLDVKSDCNQKKNLRHQELDPNDFFHAVKNCYTNVPKCCVEPYILRGYVLPYKPWRYYLKVLYIPNNETLNVWTHLLPCLYFIWMLHSYSQTIDLLAAWPLLFINLAAILLTLLSAVAHMFHSRSSFHHCCLFIFDYFGITAFAFSSTMARFFASSEINYYERIGWYNLVVLTVISSVGFYFCTYSQTSRKSSNTRHRSFKFWPNALGYLYGILPIGHRLLTSGSDDPGMAYHLLQAVFFISAPAWYVLDFPQKLWPGKFDIIGHSHQIFHICVAFACYFDILAIHHDVTVGRWSLLNNQIDYPSFAAVCVCAVLLGVYCLLIGVYFSKKFKECHQEEIDFIFGSSCQPTEAEDCDDSKKQL